MDGMDPPEAWGLVHESMSPIGDEIEDEQSDEWLPSIRDRATIPRTPILGAMREADHPDEDACHRRKDAEHGCGEGIPHVQGESLSSDALVRAPGKSFSNGTKMAKSNTRATIGSSVARAIQTPAPARPMPPSLTSKDGHHRADSDGSDRCRSTSLDHTGCRHINGPQIGLEDTWRFALDHDSMRGSMHPNKSVRCITSHSGTEPGQEGRPRNGWRASAYRTSNSSV